MANVYKPSLEQFGELAQGEVNLIPVYREFPADLETPVSVYLKLMDEMNPSFLLESVEGGEQLGRYSFVGVNPRGMVALHGRDITEYRQNQTRTYPLAAGQDILHILQTELDRFTPADLPNLPRLRGGAVGFLGYDNVRFFERLPETAQQVLDIPDAVFLLADTLVIFDHARHILMVLSNARVRRNATAQELAAAYVATIQEIEKVSERLLRPLPAIPRKQWRTRPSEIDLTLRSNKTQEQYEQMVLQAKEYIAAGDIFQVVLSQRFSRQTSAHPFAIYRALRMLNPSPYMFYFSFGPLDFQVVGASPEIHVRLEDGVAHLRPIAGTRPRGATPADDLRLEEELLADPKERAEHVMLVDLGRNDLGRVCRYGSVRVSEMLSVERYSHVMHIVSHVSGELHESMDAFALMRATFPAGTLSGAPKVRAMEIIEELEGERRSLYGGAVGYFSYDGSSDTCIAIRTMFVKDDTVYMQAGAGVVADSEPANEFAECRNKAQAQVTAVLTAENGLF
jgi:anthranilate synthase component I